MDYITARQGVSLSEVFPTRADLEDVFNNNKQKFTQEEQLLLCSRYGFNDYPVLPYPAIEALIRRHCPGRRGNLGNLYQEKFHAGLRLKRMACEMRDADYMRKYLDLIIERSGNHSLMTDSGVLIDVIYTKN